MSYSVLLVDDSAVVRHMVRRTLTISGIDASPVFEAANGQEALEVLKKNWVDLVLADINMPVMTGAEMMAAMTKDPVLASVPVVILSSEQSEKRAAEMKELGARAYVVKPFRPEAIKQIVSDVLAKCAERAAAHQERRTP